MMIKRIAAISCFVAFVISLLGGCNLAREDSGTDHTEGDRMIGILITPEHLDLFDMESYLNDNMTRLANNGNSTMNREDSRKYAGRLYAKRMANPPTEVNGVQGTTTFISDNDDYVFEGVDGLRFFMVSVHAPGASIPYHANIMDEGVSDVHLAVHGTDEAESLSLEGTVFVAPQEGSKVYYFNPVYQDSDGNVYALSGSGISGDMNAEGTAYSQNIKSSTTRVENGKKKTEDFSVNVSISVKLAPWKVKLLQMNKDHEIVAQAEYPSDAMPDSITPESQTEYIIIENHSKIADGSKRVLRDIYDRNDKQIKTFHILENGVCVGKDTTIGWE